MIAALVQDLRYGLRQRARHPGFTFAAVLTLALGIGANTVIFGFVNGLLLRPLPVAHADRLTALYATDRRSGTTRGLSYPEYLDYRNQGGVFARTPALLAGTFGLFALVLAVIGIYGVVSYAVARRTREVGIRVALGARPHDVVRLVVRNGIAPAAVGIAAGLAAALLVTGLLGSMLYDVSPRDGFIFVAIPLLLGAVAMAATYLPARRALQVDPMTALRSE